MDRTAYNIWGALGRRLILSIGFLAPRVRGYYLYYPGRPVYADAIIRCIRGLGTRMVLS